MAKLLPRSFRPIKPNTRSAPTITPKPQSTLAQELEADLTALRESHNLPPLSPDDWNDIHPFVPNTNPLSELMTSIRNGSATHEDIALYLTSIGETVGPCNVAYVLSVPLGMDKGAARRRLVMMITLRLNEPLYGPVFERAKEMVSKMSDEEVAYYFGVSGNGGIDRRNYSMNYGIAGILLYGDTPSLLYMAILALVFPDCADIVKKLIDLGPVRFRAECPDLCRKTTTANPTATSTPEEEDEFDENLLIQEEHSTKSRRRRGDGFYPPTNWFPWDAEYKFMDARKLSHDDELLAVRTLAAILSRYTSVIYTTPGSVDQRAIQRYQKCDTPLAGVISRFSIVSRPLETPMANAKVEQALIAMTRGHNLNMEPGGDGEGRRSDRTSPQPKKRRVHPSPFQRPALRRGLQNLAHQGYIDANALSNCLAIFGMNSAGYEEWERVLRLVFSEAGHPTPPDGFARPTNIEQSHVERSDALFVQAVGRDVMMHVTGTLIRTHPTVDCRSVDLLETSSGIKLVTYPPCLKMRLYVTSVWQWVSDTMHFLAAYILILQSSALQTRARYGDTANPQQFMEVAGEFIVKCFEEVPLASDYILNLSSHYIMDNGVYAGQVHQAMEENRLRLEPLPMKQVISGVISTIARSELTPTLTYFTVLMGAIANPYRSLAIFSFSIGAYISKYDCRLTVSLSPQKLSEILMEFEMDDGWKEFYITNCARNKHFLAAVRATSKFGSPNNQSCLRMELSYRSTDPDFRASFRESSATLQIAAGNEWKFPLPLAKNVPKTVKRPALDSPERNKRPALDWVDGNSPSKRTRSEIESTSSTVTPNRGTVASSIPVPASGIAGPSMTTSTMDNAPLPAPPARSMAKVLTAKKKKKQKAKAK